MLLLNKIKIALIFIIFSSSILANSEFNLENSKLFIPKVDIEGTPTFQNVEMILNFTTNTFQVIKAENYPSTLSDTIFSETTDTELNFSVGTRGCEKKSDTIICYVLITNKDVEDQRFILTINALDGHSAAIDNLGNEYLPTKVESAGQESTDFLDNTLLVDIPVLYKFYFDNIENTAKSFSALKIFIDPRAAGAGSLIITIRDLDF